MRYKYFLYIIGLVSIAFLINATTISNEQGVTTPSLTANNISNIIYVNEGDNINSTIALYGSGYTYQLGCGNWNLNSIIQLKENVTLSESYIVNVNF
jgi:hypothetical protein